MLCCYVPCVPLSALVCHDALCAMLCAMLHHQRMVATATRAAATLFHGVQVLATSEALRCRHTPVGGAGSKHLGPANENNVHFSSHLISSHLISCVRLRGLYGPARCAALCCCNVCCPTSRHVFERPSAPRCSVWLHWVRVALCCELCCFAVRRCRPHVRVCCGALCCSVVVDLLSCIALVRAARRGPTTLSVFDSLIVSGRPLRLSVLGDQWVTVCPAMRQGRSLLVGPHLCAPPAATPHVCSTPHAGGSYTAGCTLRRPRCAPKPPAS